MSSTCYFGLNGRLRLLNSTLIHNLIGNIFERIIELLLGVFKTKHRASLHLSGHR